MAITHAARRIQDAKAQHRREVDRQTSPSPRGMFARTFAPLRTVAASDSAAAPTGGRVQCDDCGKFYLATVVVSDAPYYSPEEDGFVRLHRLYCDHCNHIVLKVQACDAAGHFPGAVLSTARLRGQPQIDRFLRVHPQARGVEQS